MLSVNSHTIDRLSHSMIELNLPEDILMNGAVEASHNPITRGSTQLVFVVNVFSFVK